MDLSACLCWFYRSEVLESRTFELFAVNRGLNLIAVEILKPCCFVFTACPARKVQDNRAKHD